MDYYKMCPLKKRPVFYTKVIEDSWMNDEPEDLSMKNRFDDKCSDLAKQNFPLNLSSNSFYDQIRQTSYIWPGEPIVRPDTPASTSSDISGHSGSSLSPPTAALPTNIHMRGLTAAQIKETEALYSHHRMDTYFLPYVTAEDNHYVKTMPPCTLTPPPCEESEPEDLSMKSYIPLPALYHTSLTSEQGRIDQRSRFKCDKCDKSYSTLTGLSKHKQFHCPAAECNQVKKTFSCKSCDKVYTSLGALKMHIRTHTLPCRCSICGKCFSRPWLLQGHIRTHTGEKPFKCDHCHRAFADRSNLRAHQQTHVEVKKYICDCCTKSFSRMSLLNKHLQGGCPGQS